MYAWGARRPWKPTTSQMWRATVRTRPLKEKIGLGSSAQAVRRAHANFKVYMSQGAPQPVTFEVPTQSSWIGVLCEAGRVPCEKRRSSTRCTQVLDDNERICLRLRFR